MTRQKEQADTPNAQPEHPHLYYIQRRFTGARTLEMALASLMKAHS